MSLTLVAQWAGITHVRSVVVRLLGLRLADALMRGRNQLLSLLALLFLGT